MGPFDKNFLVGSDKWWDIIYNPFLPESYMITHETSNEDYKFASVVPVQKYKYKKEQLEEKRGGPRTRAGYLQQELVRSRKTIKAPTPTTRMDTVQT